MKDAQENPANVRHRSLALWRNLWTILIFAVGLAATTFLIAAILLFVKESWIPGAISTLASLLSGGAVQWLLTRRNEAVAEEKEAFSGLTDAMKRDEEMERRKRSRDPLFGRSNSPKH